MDFSRFTTISFDCYGTLIEWEAGILPVMRAVLGAARENAELTRRSSNSTENLKPKRKRARIRSTAMFCNRWCALLVSGLASMLVPLTSTSLSDSVPSWPPFSDTVDALRRLKKRYRLAIISNIDDDLFAQDAQTSGRRF